MHRKIERNSIKITYFCYKRMEKKEKTKFVEDSFVSSDCSVFEISIKKWYDAEFERLAAKGKDTSKFHLLADPDINVGSVCCEDYSIRFNRDEGIIDLVINTEKDSSIWDDVVKNVPVQFASCFDNPENFVYGLSTTKSKEKWYYSFKRDDKESGALFPIVGFNEMPKTLIH